MADEEEEEEEEEEGFESINDEGSTVLVVLGVKIYADPVQSPASRISGIALTGWFGIWNT